MRILPPAVAAHLAARLPMRVEVLLWLSGRDRDTGSLERLGLWSGDDHEVINLGGQNRTYYGAGGLIGMDPITNRAGLEVREHRATLSPLADEVVQAVRIYDPRLCPIEIHEWYFDPATMNPLAPPVRVLKGVITAAPITTPEEGGDATCVITSVSDAWRLTKAMPLKRSDQALRARNPTDVFRQYGDISGSVETPWGEKLVRHAEGTPPSFLQDFKSRVNAR